MGAIIFNFPELPGSPHDPNVEVIKQAFEKTGNPMTEGEARDFTREFFAQLERTRRDTEGMSREERMEYLVGRLTDSINEAPCPDDGLLHLKVSKRKVAEITESFLNRHRKKL
jgi:hypothetical protein